VWASQDLLLTWVPLPGSRQPQGMSLQLQGPAAGGCRPPPPRSQDAAGDAVTAPLNICVLTSYKCLSKPLWSPKAAIWPMSCLEKMFLYLFFFPCFVVVVFFKAKTYN